VSIAQRRAHGTAVVPEQDKSQLEAGLADVDKPRSPGSAPVSSRNSVGNVIDPA